jgi:hypothetical protein
MELGTRLMKSGLAAWYHRTIDRHESNGCANRGAR